MKVITIDGVGEVTLKKSAKAKRLILKLSAEGVPSVTVPTYVPYIVAHKFVLRQAQWIKEHARTMRPSIITNDKRVGFDHYVVFAPTEKDKPSSRVSATKIHELSLIHGHHYKNITVRAVKTRWGSCSSTKNINLSIWLMQLPEILIEYVLCHELAHLEHQHHQAAFWQEVERMLPDYKRRRKALKDYQPRLL